MRNKTCYIIRLSRLYSILETTYQSDMAQRGRLVTSESECNPPAKTKEARMNKTTERTSIKW